MERTDTNPMADTYIAETVEIESDEKPTWRPDEHHEGTLMEQYFNHEADIDEEELDDRDERIRNLEWDRDTWRQKALFLERFVQNLGYTGWLRAMHKSYRSAHPQPAIEAEYTTIVDATPTEGGVPVVSIPDDAGDGGEL